MADFDLQDQIQGLQDLSSYDIPNEHDISSMDSRAIAGVLEAAVEALAESSESITDPAVFDSYRSLLKYSESLQGSTMTKLLDSVSSGFQAELDATLRDEEDENQAYMVHKLPLEMYAFLLQWFVAAADKVKSAGEDEDAPPPPATRGRRGRGRGGKAAASRAKKIEAWSWKDHIPNILGLLCRVLRLKSQRIWTTTAERDTFISCLTSPAYRAMENVEYMKDKDNRKWAYKVICLAVKHHGHALTAQISIMQNLQFYDHAGEPMAELLWILVKEYDHSQLCDEVLREVASKTFSGQDPKGGRTCAKFLVEIVKLASRSVLKQISLLLALLDSEFYPIRVALVEVIAALIEDIATAEDMNDQNNIRKQLNGLYELLLERTLDVAVYVRAKVLQVLTKLCKLPVKFPKQRLAITTVAVACLEDSSSLVRKAAVVLLSQLITTHPYGLMHGGLLQLNEWEARYEEVKGQLEHLEGQVTKAVEGSQAGEGDDDDAEDGEEDDEEEDDARGDEGEGGEGGEGRKRKSRKKKRAEDDMDVDADGEEGEEDGEDEEDGGEGDEDVDMEGDEGGEGEGEPRRKKSKSKRRKSRKSELNIAGLNDAEAVEALQSEEYTQLKLKKRYYAEGLNFIRQVETSMKIIEDLLASKSKAEVLEAMDFFRVAHEYQFDGADAGIKRMMHLIWAKDDSATSEDGEKLKGIRPRVLECYRSIYFEPLPGIEPKQQVNRIAKNMIELTYGATLAELTSLEEMIRIMMNEGDIHSDVIGKVWNVFSSDRPLPKQQRRGAAIILGMLALARRSVVADHVEVLVKIGLVKKGRSDLTLAKYTCIALQRLNGSAKKVKGSLLDKNIRLEMDNALFKKLQDAIEAPSNIKEWFPFAEQAINTVYALAERPDLFCDQLIKNLTRRAFAPKSKNAPAPQRDPDAMDEDTGVEPGDISGPQDADDDRDVGDAFELSQLLFVVGHVAIKQIVFLEQVEREWKRQKHEKEAAEKAAGRDAPGRRGKDNGEELDQVAGNAEDEIGERVAAMRESELLYGPNSLLSVFGPMIVHICGSPPKFKNRTLRAAATLAFSKFLCVSSQFCDAHHRLLFKILETSKDPNIRSNIVIALGDVAVSFSSIIDENSAELYKGLSDKNLVVKKNTLMVLTHLILNGMIKVKGQLGEMAKCLEDQDERIADLAKLFFSELATKDNAIYNNLPDVISHLSVGAHAVEEESFQSTMMYIFKFIEKERQAENIVEKLCQRFRLTEDPRQWRDIAFCMSLLPFKSERSVKKLIEGLPHYRDKLREPDVFLRFQEILTKARANKSQNKPDAELNEFETILEEHKRQGEEDQEFEKRVQGKKAAAKKRAVRRTRKKAVQAEDSD